MRGGGRRERGGKRKWKRRKGRTGEEGEEGGGGGWVGGGKEGSCASWYDSMFNMSKIATVCVGGLCNGTGKMLHFLDTKYTHLLSMSRLSMTLSFRGSHCICRFSSSSLMAARPPTHGLEVRSAPRDSKRLYCTSIAFNWSAYVWGREEVWG